MKTAIKRKPAVTKKPETLNDIPTMAPITVFGLRRVHDGVTWLYEACYITVEGLNIVSIKSEPATSREIAEAKLSRDLVGLQFQQKGPGFGKLPDDYFR